MVNIGIIIYPQVEVLDFCGPFEVFRNAKLLHTTETIEVFTISEDNTPVDAQGLLVIPTYSFDNCPDLDILVIPGGNGNWLKDQKSYQEFLKQRFPSLSQLLTVCTGALLPATSDIYPPGIEVTTHQEAIATLQEIGGEIKVRPEVRFTHSDKIITSGGISAGIDSSLYTVSLLWGRELADEIAKYMEYHWLIDQPNMKDPAILPNN